MEIFKIITWDSWIQATHFISTWDSLKAVALWGEGNHSISGHIILNKIRINSGKQWGAHKAIGE